MSFKRPRNQSPTPSQSTSSSSPSRSPSPTAKATRTMSPPRSNSKALVCSFPPTCHRKPTRLESTTDMESHYAMFHTNVCVEEGCSCVFPDARLLALHQTECHDPLAAVRKDRGEKIFACHLESCGRVFLTPKSRRLHLIQAHGYPKAYFFAVTNKGIGGLLDRWGQGASLMRGEWKPRLGGGDDGDGGEDDILEPEPRQTLDHSEDTDESDSAPHQHHHHHRNTNSVDALADSMTSLSLVPSSIRFGRGGRKGGLMPAPAPPVSPTKMDVDRPMPVRGGKAGRGRRSIGEAVGTV